MTNCSCKSFRKIATTPWLLAALVLALMAPSAYADAGVGVSMNLGAGNLAQGVTRDGSFTITNTGDTPGTITNDVLIGIPACGTDLAGFQCPAGDIDPNVITINSATSTAGCFALDGVTQATWTVTDNGDGTFDLDPSVVIVLPVGGVCTVSFNFTVDNLPTVDSRPLSAGLQSDASVGPVTVLGDDETSASATGTTFKTYDANCDVEIDKQVSCDGGISWHDVTGEDDSLVEDDANTVGDNEELIGDGNCDPGELCTLQTFGCVGWGAFDTDGDGNVEDAEPVLGRWIITNTGNIPLYNCELTDSNTLLLGDQPVALNDPLEVGGEQTVNDSGLCTEAFDELEPNTATVLCACEDEPLIDADPTTAASDTADVNCQEPGLSLTKLCDPQTEGSNDVTITATNTGESSLQNCILVDRVNIDSTECPATAEDGTDVPVVPNMFNLSTPGVPGPGSEQESTGSVAGLLDDSCNKAFIECDIVGTEVEDDNLEDGNNDGICDEGEACVSKTIARMDDDICEVSGDECLTRTPGFWGTHPHVTALFLPLDNCGVEIDNVVDSSEGSAIEDMCSVGRDAKINSVYDQQVQLERQCMAAVLNVAATEEAFDASCDNAYPGVGDLIAECCTADESICRSSLEPGEEGVNERTIQSCISGLDAFNNNDEAEPQDLTGTPFEMPGPADPSECQDSKNNGFLNDRPRAETGKECKGKGCPD